jgi:hypothetical protein
MKTAKWVNWRKLCNPSIKDRPRDVIDNLRALGWMEPGSFNPTPLAQRQGAARVSHQDGKPRTLWNRTRYLSECRKLRRDRSCKVAVYPGIATEVACGARAVELE